MIEAKSKSESRRLCIQTDCAVASILKEQIERLQADIETMGNFIIALVAMTHDDDFAMEGKEILKKVGLTSAQED